MVICGGELDAADEQLDGAQDQLDEDAENDLYGSSTQKCLRVDLRRFGLGKDLPSTVLHASGFTIHDSRQTWLGQPILAGPRTKWNQPHV